MLEPVFFARDFTPRCQPWHRFSVTHCSWTAAGGPQRATLVARQAAGALHPLGGPLGLAEPAGLLRCPVELWTPDGRRAWWGYAQAVKITDGAACLTFSLDSLANRVRARYYEPNPNQFSGGSLVWTAWAEELLSQSVYGIKERQITTTAEDGSDPSDAAQAARLRDSILAGVNGPQGEPAWPGPAGPAQAGPVTLEVECRGWFETLDWRYYEQPAGLAQNLPNVAPVAADCGTTGQQYPAQSFRTPVGGWRLESVWCSLKKVAAPADSLYLMLREDNGGLPGNINHAVSDQVSGSSFPNNFAWQKFTFSSPYTLAANTPYWLIVVRTGALENTNFYRLQVDESCQYPNGVLRCFDGGAYALRSPAADLVFRASGSMANTSQLALMAANPGGGQFFTGLRWDAASTVYSNPNRPGLLTCKDELLRLLAAGSAAGRLLAEVTAERVLVIRQKPGSGSPKYVLGTDGVIRLRGGGAAQPGPGIAGEWEALETGWPGASALTPGAIFLEEVEFRDGAVRPARGD